MRALAGPVMLLVVVGGIGLYRALATPEEPPRSFLDLELSGADPARTGSCYSLSTVLIANLAFSPALREWKAAHDNAWTLSLEDIHQTAAGPLHVFQRFTFEQRAERVELVKVEATEGVNTDPGDTIDALLGPPNERGSTPVERCLGADATGYLFKSKPRR